MDIHTFTPAFEAGLTTLRDAGISGVLCRDADDLADAVLDDEWDASGLTDEDLNDASRQWWAVGAHETLMASYEEGLRERASCAIDLEHPYFNEEPGSSNLEEMLEAQEWAAYRATLIFEDLPADAPRVDFIGALRSAFPVLGPRYVERIVDGVIARRAKRPVPQFVPDANGFIHTGCSLAVSEEQARLRRKAINMYLEKRAARPVHDPVPAPSALSARATELRDRFIKLASDAGMLPPVPDDAPDDGPLVPELDVDLADLTSPPGLVGEIVDWMEAIAERPNRALYLAGALTFVGTLAGRKFASPSDLRTNQYFVTLAPSGHGKDHPIRKNQIARGGGRSGPLYRSGPHHVRQRVAQPHQARARGCLLH